MRFVRYEHEGEIHTGYLDGDQVGPLTGDIFGEFVRHRRRLAVGEVRLLAPLRPGKILGVSNNFADQLRETGQPAPELPALYLRPPSGVIGPEQAILLPPQSQRVEFGAELALVIGRRARRVTAEEALACVHSYTCAGDVTAQDLVEQDGQPTRGKSFDTFCVLGPCLTTGLDPTEMLITGRVNGETRQMSSTHDLLFSVPQLIAFISSILTLEPGDVILTGTPAGAPTLAAGQTVEVEIEGIGKMSNPVRAE